MRSSIHIYLMASLVALLFIGCGEESSTTAGCSSDADCDLGTICYIGASVPGGACIPQGDTPLAVQPGAS